MASVGLMTAAFPELAGTAWRRLTDAVVDHYPENAEFLRKGFGSYAPPVKETAFRTAESIERLFHGRLEEVVAGDRSMCEMVLEEDLPFRRNDSCGYSGFEDADREVYLNAARMRKCISGLLLSQILWSNHLQLFDFYVRHFVATLKPTGWHLEVGPGHGLLLYQAAERPVRELGGWDVRRTSLDRTKGCLADLGITAPVLLEERNVFEPLTASDLGRFDRIVISEVLEHVERPLDALTALRSCLAPGGSIFVTAPVNSPALDHIYLFREPEELVELVRRAGFEVISTRFAPVTGWTEARARKRRMPISTGVVGTA